MNQQESIIHSTMSMSKSHLRYLSPQPPPLQSERQSTFLPRETIQSNLRESQFNYQQRETVIPLDVQYTITKKVEQQNNSDFEVRIQSLQHEVELWRKRYLELMAANDKNVANEEIIRLQEGRIQLLSKENQELYLQMKELMMQNDELNLSLQNQELVESLTKSQADYATLQQQLKDRLADQNQWREKYNQLEQRFQEFKALEMNCMATEGQQKGMQQQTELWQDRYWGMMEERDKLQDELRKLNDRLNGQNIEVLQRTNATELKLKDNEIKNLLEQLKYLEEQIQEWRRRALALETDLEVKDQEVDNQKQKNHKLLEQITRLNQQLNGKSKEMDEMNGIIQDLEQQLREIEHLKEQLGNKDEIIQKKSQDNEYLRKEMARLENNNSELRHEKLLKIQFEQENKRISENCSIYQQESNDRKSQLDALKIKYGNLEIKNNELTQLLDQSKYLQLQIDNLNNSIRTAQDRINFLENNNTHQLQEIEELNARIQQLKGLEIDNKKQIELLALKENEIQLLRKRITQFEMIPRNNSTAELELRIKSLLSTIDILRGDNSTLSAKCDSLLSDSLILNQQFSSLEITHSTKPQDKSEVNQWKLRFQQSQAENESLIFQKQALQENCDFLTDQMRLLQKQLIGRRQEVEDWRRQAGSYYVSATETKKILTESEKQNETLKKENQDLNSQNDDLKQQNGISTANANKYQSEFQSLQLKQQGFINLSSQEIQQLNIKIQECIKDDALWKEKYLKSEQLNHDLKGIKEKYEFTQSKLTQSEDDNNKLNQILKENSLKHPLQQQNNSQNELIQQQLESLQSKYDKQSMEYLELSQLVPVLQQQLEDKDTKSLEDKIAELLKEIQRINLAYQNKVRESEEQRNRCNILESTVSDLRFLEKRVPELMNTISQLRQNITNNLDEISLLNHDSDKQNQQIAKQQLLLKQYQYLQTEHASLKSNYYSKEQEIAKLKTSLYLVETDLLNTSQQKDEFIQKYQQQAQENLELKSINAKKQNDLDKLINKLSKVEVKALEADRLAQKVKILENQVIQLNDANMSLTQDNSTLNNNVEQLNKLNEQIQFKYNSIIPFRKQWEDMQIVQTKNQQAIQNIQIQLANQIESKKQALKQRDEQAQLINQKDATIQQKGQIIGELELMQENLNSQQNELVARVNDLQQENFQLQVLNQNLSMKVKKSEVIESDYLKLRDLYDQAIDQINDLKTKLSIKEAEAASFQTIKEGLESRVALLASEIERLSHMLKTKNDEIENLRDSLQRTENLVSQLSASEGDARRSEETIIQLKGQVETAKENLNNKSKECEELRVLKENLENKSTLLGAELEELKSLLARSEAKAEDVQSSILRLQEECSSLKQLEGSQTELKTRISSQQEQYERLQQQFNEKNKELVGLKQKMNDYESQAQQMKQNELEEQKLRLQIQTLNKEKEEWYSKVDQLQRLVEKLEKSRNDLENKCAMLASEVERLNNKYRVNQQQNQILQDQVGMLKDDLDRLTGQLQEAIAQNEEIRRRQISAQGSFIERQVTMRTSNHQ